MPERQTMRRDGLESPVPQEQMGKEKSKSNMMPESEATNMDGDPCATDSSMLD